MKSLGLSGDVSELKNANRTNSKFVFPNLKVNEKIKRAVFC